MTPNMKKKGIPDFKCLESKVTGWLGLRIHLIYGVEYQNL